LTQLNNFNSKIKDNAQRILNVFNLNSQASDNPNNITGRGSSPDRSSAYATPIAVTNDTYRPVSAMLDVDQLYDPLNVTEDAMINSSVNNSPDQSPGSRGDSVYSRNTSPARDRQDSNVGRTSEYGGRPSDHGRPSEEMKKNFYRYSFTRSRQHTMDGASGGSASPEKSSNPSGIKSNEENPPDFDMIDAVVALEKPDYTDS
jgi:hypothetical protein